MKTPDAATPSKSDRYREMACALRAFAAALKYPETRDELSLLADNYERLAQYLATAPGLSGLAGSSALDSHGRTPPGSRSP